MPLFFRAKAAGVDCSPVRMIAMKLRHLDHVFLVDEMIRLNKGDIEATFDELEGHVLAGGDLDSVVDAMISAHKGDLDVSFKRLCALDLAGRDVVWAVRACIEPVMIEVPPRSSGKKQISAVGKDGIRLGVTAKVTVRADIKKLVGGASHETVIARVGEGIVSAVGSAASHQNVLENPELIAERILDAGLDVGTAFEIVSVDIGDVEVHDNIGARLQEMQAQADQEVAQARAEGRRALAVAATRENGARITEMQAVETRNKAAIPTDMASAYRRGAVWVAADPVYSVISRKLWDVAG